MFTPIKLEPVLTVDSIVTLHYFEYARGYAFSGERHRFWELVYIDSGEVGIVADKKGYTLKQGEIIFHKPNEYHNIWTNGVFANVFVITFYSSSSAMSFFNNKILRVNNFQKNLLSLLLNEGRQAFASPLNLPFQTEMTLKDDAPFGARQIIKTYMEQLLISFIRSGAEITQSEIRQGKSFQAKEENEDRIIESIILHMKSNLDKQLTLDGMCENICFSKSYVKQLFSRKVGEGIIEHFNRLKIEEARRLISEGRYSFTEISDMLGFSSIHYFSRMFKNKTGLSPSEYAKSIQKNLVLL